jgi:diguanylate cyclase (GGDEF)-like protein
MIIKNIIVHPLETLRDYAYRTTKIPHRFFITELEMIRHSLKKTFHRLNIEQKKLYHLSTRDVLSGLYNRQSLLEKLESLIYNSQRNNTKFALLFIDLDNFKNVNDSLGHDVGDKLLILVAQNLLNTVRKNDIVSRLGGDEFIIVLPNIEDETTVMEVVERIQNIFKQTIEVNFSKIAVTASIGITIYPNDATNTTELLKNADIAMYKAKAIGKNHYYFFTQELNSYVQEKLQIQKYIQDALTHDYFQLYYQPKVDIQSGKIVACEALIRLIHPEVGLIPPDKFIKIAEQNGFIIPLGRSILQKAISQLHHWENTPLKNLKVSINISALELEDTQFLENLRTMIQTIETSRLDIEITESVFISGYQEKIKIIHEIKKLGLTLSLDDFGTGYSSLSYLKELPFDTLKIDKAFVDDINTQDGETFIKMIVNIAKTLNLEVVAEGVEREDQKEFLKSISCDQYQGYLCSKPLKADEFENLFMRCNQEH